MILSSWYKDTFQIELNKQDTILLLKDINYRPRRWVPDWNLAEFNRAQLELTASNISEISDPRLDPNWADSNWDDVLLDDWWQFVVVQSNKYALEELF